MVRAGGCSRAVGAQVNTTCTSRPICETAMVAAGDAAPQVVDVRPHAARRWAWRSLTLLTPGPATFPHPYVRSPASSGSLRRDRPLFSDVSKPGAVLCNEGW